MILEKYISDLLYKHDCVIIPEFGAFIAQKFNSGFDSKTSSFYPPNKQIVFNPELKESDGLLVREVANTESISFEEAEKSISERVNFWENHLVANSSLSLKNLGTINRDNKGNLTYLPDYPNFLPEAYGLDSIKPKYILKTGTRSGSSTIWWKAAALIPIIAGGYFYFSQPKPVENFVSQQWSGIFTPISTSGMQAAQISESPINTVFAKIETAVDKNIYDHQVIAGAYGVKSEADKKVEKLNKQGFPLARLTQKKGRFFYVAFKTFESKEEATEFRRNISEEYPEAWIYSAKD